MTSLVLSTAIERRVGTNSTRWNDFWLKQQSETHRDRPRALLLLTARHGQCSPNCRKLSDDGRRLAGKPNLEPKRTTKRVSSFLTQEFWRRNISSLLFYFVKLYRVIFDSGRAYVLSLIIVYWVPRKTEHCWGRLKRAFSFGKAWMKFSGR